MNLNRDDARRLLTEMVTADAILVGGQAVMFWADYFKIPLEAAAMTADIDYVADRAIARRVAARLQHPHQIHFPKMDHPTVNTAQILITLPHYPDPIIVDFLVSVAGMTPREVEAGAVPVDLDGAQMMIFMPLALLHSKLLNLLLLEAKRNEEGIAQAKAAVAIGRAFVDSRLNDRAPAKAILASIEKIFAIALSRAGLFAFHEYGIDCLAVIPLNRLTDGVVPPAFLLERLPRQVAEVERKRSKK